MADVGSEQSSGQRKSQAVSCQECRRLKARAYSTVEELANGNALAEVGHQKSAVGHARLICLATQM